MSTILRRPADLCEVMDVRGADFWLPLAEFMDEFYLAHDDKCAQQDMIDAEPRLLGVPQADGFIAAVAEHLALRWGLEVPTWTSNPERDGPVLPMFRPDISTMRNQYLVESPYAFRKRNIFTGREPLQRARWPKDEPRIQPLY